MGVRHETLDLHIGALRGSLEPMGMPYEPLGAANPRMAAHVGTERAPFKSWGVSDRLLGLPIDSQALLSSAARSLSRNESSGGHRNIKACECHGKRGRDSTVGTSNLSVT